MIEDELLTEEIYTNLTALQKDKIEKLIGEIKCDLDFRCYKSRFKDICEAKNIGMEDFIDCHDKTPTKCRYAMSFGDAYFCHCPLRNYLAREIGV
jgi:hypothetical protein